MRESPQTLDRATILNCIPHKGASCLLDRVCRWDEHVIACESRSHLLAENPYRLNGKLPSVCLIEYAAQAFALHAWLKSPASEATPLLGYLATVRELRLSVARLDSCPCTLTIAAEALVTESRGLLYAFSVQHQGNVIAHGRAAVSFAATLR